MSKSKSFIREIAWWPGVDKMIEEAVRSCLQCQVTGLLNVPEPLKMAEIPSELWEHVRIDFKGPMPKGEMLMVLTDVKSHYPEVVTLKNNSAHCVLPKLEHIFSRFGQPKQLSSNNGPPFNGKEFSNFLKKHGIAFTPNTKDWPQGNGLIESFMKPLLKACIANNGVQNFHHFS